MLSGTSPVSIAALTSSAAQGDGASAGAWASEPSYIVPLPSCADGASSVSIAASLLSDVTALKVSSCSEAKAAGASERLSTRVSARDRAFFIIIINHLFFDFGI